MSNILVHREYTSAFPAKIIIKRNCIITENWNLPKNAGRIDPDSFTPYPKNPLLANFFIHIGRAGVLGSGVRNLYKFTKMYSGGEPELIDGDVFRTIVPLTSSDIKISDNVDDSAMVLNNKGDNILMVDNMKDGDEMLDNKGGYMSTEDNVRENSVIRDNERRKMILAYLSKNDEINATAAAKIIGRSPTTAKRVLLQLVSDGLVVTTGANRNRKYRIAK